MSRKLHEFFDADIGKLSRASQGDATLAEQFQREQLGRAAGTGTLRQSRQLKDLFGYFNGHSRHAWDRIVADATACNLSRDISLSPTLDVDV